MDPGVGRARQGWICEAVLSRCCLEISPILATGILEEAALRSPSARPTCHPDADAPDSGEPYDGATTSRVWWSSSSPRGHHPPPSPSRQPRDPVDGWRGPGPL